jgi:hypothetical protein
VRRLVAVLAPAAVLGGIGLLVSYTISLPTGAEHHCPSGAPPSVCSYPPDQFKWSVWWTIGGLIAGLFVGLIIQASLHRRAR